MYQALYRKYRPKTLDDVCGQDTIVKTIKNSIMNNKINHAYLFTGPRGTGKTSVAKIFARMVNCENLKNSVPCGKCVSCLQTNNSDIIEIDAASNNGVDEIRELKNKVNLVPSYGKYKIYIIDEVHMLTTGAFNALLKTLEEPPKHIIFILATTDPHKIPETILSRCQRFDFKKVNEKNIVNYLKNIAKKEKINIDDEALIEIARIADGGMRDSIGILDQANSYTDDQITVEDIHTINGTITLTDMGKLVKLLIDSNLEEIFKKLDFYNDSGKNFVKLSEELINFMRNLLLFKEAPNYFKEINSNQDIYNELTNKINTKKILEYINEINEALNKMKMTNNTKLILELSIISLVDTQKNVNQTSNIFENSKKLEPQDEKIEQKKEIVVDKKEEENQENTKEDLKSNIDVKKMKEFTEIRINNTLAKFKKRSIPTIKEKISTLENYLLDPDCSKYASIILDGQLKAASEENLIFVYKNERLSALFNENITKIEETLEKVLENKYKVIATDINDWEKIKEEFNNKKKQYKYEEETIKISDIFKENKNSEFSAFEDIIEYN